MRLGPRRTAKLTLWTLAGLTWSWAAVAATAHPPADTASPTPPPEPQASTAPGASAAMPVDAPGKVLVLRLSTPPEREVIRRRVLVDVPAARTAPAAGSAPAASAPPPSPPAPVPAPPPQRSSGS